MNNSIALRKYAVWCAAQVKRLLGPEGRRALSIAWLHACGRATDAQLNSAWHRATIEAMRVPLWNIRRRYAAWAAVAAATNSVAEAAKLAARRAETAHHDPVTFVAEKSATYNAVMAA